MAQTPGVVIVGASVAGLHAAEQLRAAGYRHRVDLIDAETRLPYDRPPLSKSVLLGKATHDDIRLHGDAALAALGVELHSGVPATGLHERTVRLACCVTGRLNCWPARRWRASTPTMTAPRSPWVTAA
jgi:NAD(P)H-nitrite reductase large subunit